MQASTTSTLNSLVEEHITNLIRDAVCVQRHAKRARFHQTTPGDDGIGVVRRRLHAEDVNLALQWRGSEKLYATGTVVPSSEDSTKKVDLNAYIKSENVLKPPSEIGLTMHWLAVDGVQPNIPQNPNMRGSLAHLIEDEEEDTKQNVKVRQLLPRLLSEELQLYFTRITTAVEQGGATPEDRQTQDAALLRVAQDAGLQELVPFFVRYVSTELFQYVGNPEHCRTLVRLAWSLLLNPHLHLELHLHQLLPGLITCVVAHRLSSRPFDNHWALRTEGARTLVLACALFGAEYPALKPRVLKTMFEAIDETKPLTTCFGGITGITLFGHMAIEAFLMPLASTLMKKWDKDLETLSGLEARLEVQQCQQALVQAVGIYLAGESEGTLSSFEELVESFGERLVPLTHSAMGTLSCFI